MVRAGQILGPLRKKYRYPKITLVRRDSLTYMAGVEEDGRAGWTRELLPAPTPDGHGGCPSVPSADVGSGSCGGTWGSGMRMKAGGAGTARERVDICTGKSGRAAVLMRR